MGACGDSDGNGGMTPNDFEREIVRSLCSSDFASCCQAQGETYGEESCRAFANVYAHHYLTGVRFDPDAAKRCLEAIARVPQTCEDYPEGVEPCFEIWQPNRKVGESCSDSRECVPENGVPAYCGGSSVCTTGDRVPYQRGLAGDPCALSCFDLECWAQPEDGDQVACYESDELYCSTLTNLCQPIPHIGEPCESLCVGTYCRLGTCAVPVPDGEPCLPDDVCETWLCVEGICQVTPYFLQACSYLG